MDNTNFKLQQKTFNLNSNRDYRDDLRDILDDLAKTKGISRYRICKAVNIDNGTLSNVLSKRRHFSFDLLMKILDAVGYKLNFSKIENFKFDKSLIVSKKQLLHPSYEYTGD